MSNDNHIKTFTALDIEKYHKGQLSAKEMHALEKAALDDPFLADALEGYAAVSTNIDADIAGLKQRLTEKTEQAMIIPIHKGGQSSFPWLRAAVMIVVLAGVGLLAYQFLFKASDNNDIAETTKQKAPEKNVAADSLHGTDTTASVPGTVLYDNIGDNKTVADSEAGKQKALSNRRSGAFQDSVTKSFDISNEVATTSSSNSKVIEEKADDKKQDVAAPVQKDDVVLRGRDAAAKFEKKEAALNKPLARNDTDKDGVTDANTRAKTNAAFGYSDIYRNTNVFRGRVTDANNNALPFANITNTRDNVGTYSDAQGNFTLVSPDSVLDVQVRSLGFENNNAQLRNYVPDNRVLMQEDRSLNAKILDTVKRNISRARGNTMTVEEPEPEDGWDSYGSYVANNLNIPSNFERKKTGTTENIVEVSFEVSKNGEPVNLRVEKSLCDQCDKEAMRLIKDGPKWKRKAKKSKRATVAVPFIKPE